MKDHSEGSIPIENKKVVLCPSCMAQNWPLDYFCSECGCPIGQYVNLDPLKSIYSQGWLYRRTVSGRITLIVVIGMYLIFGPTIILSLFFLAQSGFKVSGLLSFMFPLLSAMILYRVTKNYLHFQ